MGLFDQYLSPLCCAVLSCLVMSYSLQPHGLQPARLLCPWGFSWPKCWRRLPRTPPGNLSNPGIPHYRQILYHLSHHGSSLCLLLDCKYHKERKHIQFFSLFNFRHLSSWHVVGTQQICVEWMLRMVSHHRGQSTWAHQQSTGLRTRVLALKGLCHGGMKGRRGQKCCQFRRSPKSLPEIFEETHGGIRGLTWQALMFSGFYIWK